jgi:hypothetical protein
MIVRFSEFEYYNINQDEDWVRFMATTPEGSYFSEVPRETFSKYREQKQEFKDKVVEAIGSHMPPMEIEL